MTIHALHGGDGYEYLTRQVATADRERARGQGLTDYYAEHGTPPGAWAGRGAEIMGVSGEVSEAQMRALYGEGIHPDADAKISAALAAGMSTKEALAEAQLGSGLYRFKGGKSEITGIYEELKAEFLGTKQRSPTRDEWLDLRTKAARQHLSTELARRPTAEEITKALSDEKRKGREAVVGWDCVFTPQKSVSILWGLGDDELRRVIWRCHEDAVAEVLERMEDNYALARRGKGGTKLIDAQGLTYAKFQHYDNRTGDMNPHTHVVVSSRVLGSDGKWSSLRAQALIKATVSLSCEYNAALTGKLKRELGLRFEERIRTRGKEPVLEVVGISDDMIKTFSRRPDILARTEELVRQYRQVHGRNPSKAVQYKLQQQATLDTREAKPLPMSLREMIHEWDQRARAFLGDGRTSAEFVDDVLHLSHNPDAAGPYEAARVAIGVGADLGGRSAVLASDERQLTAAIGNALNRCTFAEGVSREDAAAEVAGLLSESNSAHVLDDLAAEIEARRRRVYDPQTIAAEVLETVSRRRATWSEVHIRAAAEDRLAVCDFASDQAHRLAVESIVAAVRDRHSVLLTVDPEEVPASLARRNGESVFNQPASTSVLYSSEAVLAAEARLQHAAQDATAELVTSRAVASAIEAVEEGGRPRKLGVRTGKPRRLNPGQRAFVQHLCTSGARLAVAVGPAGAGKTTALKAVVRAWHDDGREVLALSPQKSAARVLSDEIGVPAETIDALLWAHRTGRGSDIARGAMILVDEAGMASTANLHELQQLADRYGAVVRWVGDPHQLSAVESGGALRLIANDTGAPELDQVVRFENPDEAAATLAVRSGSAVEAWEFYSQAGRIHGGMVAELREQILAAHLADTDAGKSSLMMAATTTDVFALNGAAQVAHILRGSVERDGPETALADGHRGRVGDVIVTRQNAKRLRITGGHRAGTSVDNGDLWRVDRVHEDGSISAVGTRHRGRVVLPAKYVSEHVELGYASTVHRAQGMTVQRAHLLMNTTLGRALAYVGLSRATEENHVYAATDTLPDPAWDHAPDEPLTERDVFVRVVAREDDNLTATEVMRAEQARIDDPDRLREMYEHCRELLGNARADYQLERALPVVLFADVQGAEGYARLRDTLTVADAIGMDTGEIIGDIVTNGGRDEGESLLTARDAAAVLSARADRLIGAHVAATLAAHTTAQGPETLAFTVDADTAALIAAAENLNTGEETLATSSRGGRFWAVRDVVLPDVVPLPSRHPGIDTALAEFAANLRARLLGNDADALAEARPQVPRTPEQREALLDTYTDAANTAVRRAKIERDYTYYARELGRDRARWLLDRSMPVVLVRQVERGRGYSDLLDTIALADAHGLNTGALVATITADQGDHDASLITARDAAAVLRRRADTWIGEQRQVSDSRGFQALKDLPPLADLRPIPAEHPGMDVAMAEYADELRRLLLDLPDDAPDWRARAAERGAAEAVDELDLDETTPDTDGENRLTAWDVADGWPINEQQPTELPYPELGEVERAIRLHTDLTRARARIGELRDQIMDRATPQQAAIEPMVSSMRMRMDELRPLVIAARDAEDAWEAAEFDAIAAEDAYATAAQAHPDAVDETFLASVREKIEATTDPALAARLTEQLELSQASTIDADVAWAKYTAVEARRTADALRADYEQAQTALDAAAGGQKVPDEAEVHEWRNMAEQLAMDELNQLRAEAAQLEAQATRAERHAVVELMDTAGLTDAGARWELQNRYSQATGETVEEATAPEVAPVLPPPSEEVAETAAAEVDSGAAADEPITDPALAREQQVREQLQAHPIRMRTDADLTALIRSLRRAADRSHDFTAWPSDAATASQVEQIQAAHAALAGQVAAIEVAQRDQQAAHDAEAALTQARTETARARAALDAISGLRVKARKAAEETLRQAEADQQTRKTEHEAAVEAVHVAVEAARAAGAPQPQWTMLLARAADTAALAAELEAAETTDAREQQLRERAERRAQKAAQDLTAALAERDRRAGLSPMDRATEHSIRGTQATSAGPDRNADLAAQQAALARQQAEAEQQQRRDMGPEL